MTWSRASNSGLALLKEARMLLGLKENNASIRISAALAMITRSTILFSRLKGLFSNVNQAL